jgi:mannose-1-phosphate guanylyltransferase
MSKITKNVFIVSEKSHSDAILKQLKTFDKRKMIVEPSRKGTANCTILAVKHIQKYFKKDISDENILFIHADHIFNNKHAFISCIKNASKERTGNNIVIGGKKPTHPDTKYGYVETKKITSKAYKVLAFHEKPELKIAKFLYKKSNYF